MICTTRCQRRERRWVAHPARASWGVLCRWMCSGGLAVESGCTPQVNRLCTTPNSLHVLGQVGSSGSNDQWGPAYSAFLWIVDRKRNHSRWYVRTRPNPHCPHPHRLCRRPLVCVRVSRPWMMMTVMTRLTCALLLHLLSHHSPLDYLCSRLQAVMMGVLTRSYCTLLPCKPQPGRHYHLCRDQFASASSWAHPRRFAHSTCWPTSASLEEREPEVRLCGMETPDAR
jgi:hypothetical protein